MIFPHLARIVRTAPATGTQDLATGVYTTTVSPVETLIYDGPCDAQDNGAAISRSADGAPTQSDGVTVYLPELGGWTDDAVTAALHVGDQVTITYEDGSLASGAIERITRLDGAFTVRWMTS